MGNITTTVVVYGQVVDTKGCWTEWLKYAMNLTGKCINDDDYISVKGEGFNNGKISLLNERFMNRLDMSLETEQPLESIELYALPTKFSTAIFDFDVYTSRVISKRGSFVQLTVRNELLDQLELDCSSLKSELCRFIKGSSVKVFEIDIKDLPLKVIMSGNKKVSAKSLKVITDEVIDKEA